MRKLVHSALAALAIGGASVSAQAAGGEVHIEKQDWSFNGVMGTFDKAQLQRGMQVYMDVCASCHGLKYVAYRNLSDLGYSEAQIKVLLADRGYEVEDGPDDFGDMYMRPAIPSDTFISPFPNDNAARASNGGALPPDLSLMAKKRVGGPDYIYALLTGYHEAPEGFDLPPGMHYNAAFSGHKIAMANPLFDGIVEYADGTEASVDQMAHDISAFLMWTAEPKLEARKNTGLRVMLFLLAFTVLAYFAKRRVWKNVKH